MGIVWQLFAQGKIMSQKTEGKRITLILDEGEAVFEKRMAKELSTERYPIGATFHEFTFPNMNISPKNNKMILKVAKSSLTFEYAMGYTVFMADTRKVNDISMKLGMGEGKDGVTHEKAKEHMYAILEQIMDSGWKRYIDNSNPRICAKEALLAEHYDSNLSGVGLDPNYFMNFEEWFFISTYHWNFFYKNEALMDITLHRQAADKDLAKPGGYFLSIDVKSVENSLRSNFKPEERDDWRALWMKELPRYQAFRPKAETDAIAKGYHICTKHEEAPFDIGILPPLHKEK